MQNITSRKEPQLYEKKGKYVRNYYLKNNSRKIRAQLDKSRDLKIYTNENAQFECIFNADSKYDLQTTEFAHEILIFT